MDAYISNRYGWAARAARIAGCPPAGARVAAVRMLREADVRAAIDEAWQAELADMAKGRLERALAQHLAFKRSLAKSLAQIRRRA